jgi:hypothetical protein
MSCPISRATTKKQAELREASDCSCPASGLFPSNQASPLLRCGTCALSLGRAIDSCRWCPINPSEVTEPRQALRLVGHVRQSEIHQKNCSRKTAVDQLRPGPAACRASSKHTTSPANGCSCTPPGKQPQLLSIDWSIGDRCKAQKIVAHLVW